MEKGFFVGWNVLVCVVVALQALGGVIVATVAKYADNVSKGFSSAVSLICTCVISGFLFDWKPSPEFVLGAGLVCLAICLYAQRKPSPTTSPYMPVSQEEPNGNVQPQQIPGAEEDPEQPVKEATP